LETWWRSAISAIVTSRSGWLAQYIQDAKMYR
jgi:hypothetical protein